MTAHHSVRVIFMISYYFQDVDFKFREKRRTNQWLRLTAESEIRRISDISIIFCSDPYILDINQKYLGHDYFTDIITFDYTEGSRISGDLFISLDTVKTNAEQYAGNNYTRELYRVIIHGILHLCGINDKGLGEREQMEAAEEQALKLLDELQTKP